MKTLLISIEEPDPDSIVNAEGLLVILVQLIKQDFRINVTSSKVIEPTENPNQA